MLDVCSAKDLGMAVSQESLTHDNSPPITTRTMQQAARAEYIAAKCSALNRLLSTDKAALFLAKRMQWCCQAVQF